jgi:ABC-type nickel/cobalt efflux system permease component RcnA
MPGSVFSVVRSWGVFTLFSIIVIGFFLGMRHATDPDHVIAITTVVSSERNAARAALMGAFWGLGHTVTIFVVGTSIILFNLVIPTRLGLSMELSVGFMLIGLGGWNLANFLRAVPEATQLSDDPQPLIHSHLPRHGDYVHTHPHMPSTDTHSHSLEGSALTRLDRALGKVGAYQLLRPLLVGVVHGLAGSAAVTLLILASIRDSNWAILYLLVFGVGTIAGMMLITMSIASTFRRAGSRYNGFARQLAMASGLVSIVFGLFVAYQICVVQGLFSAYPEWTPR